MSILFLENPATGNRFISSPLHKPSCTICTRNSCMPYLWRSNPSGEPRPLHPLFTYWRLKSQTLWKLMIQVSLAGEKKILRPKFFIPQNSNS
ncbi:hypothetical protein I3843_03G174400 [Carya illinoinensis]|nr:hypothetical protein I3843_03G174400 [Carya illinoinensis]